MKSKATFQLVGRIGSIKKLVEFPNGKLLKISVATNHYFKDKEGNTKESTDWYNVDLWNNLADIGLKNLEVGKQMLVEGNLKPTSYKKEDKDTVYRINLNGTNLIAFGYKNDSETSQEIKEEDYEKEQ
jgi:single-strand DNA-binding protein